MQTTATELRKMQESLRPEGSRNLVLRFNNMPAIQLLNGNRFIVSSPDGDISVIDHGFYRDDTRFLSTLTTRINGLPLAALNSNYSTPYSAEFYLTNPEVPETSMGKRIPKESLMIARHRLIERNLQEDFYVFNVSLQPTKFSLSFEFDADFLDLFEVKERVFKDRPDMGKPEDKKVEIARKINREFLEKQNVTLFSWKDEETGFGAATAAYFSEKGKVEGNKITYDLSLEPSGGNFHVLYGFGPFLGNEL
ncbi:MAG TPA: glycogen debranching N-terminal domain-containing protein [Nitrososphaerales archaeon]|nr:glycogen debranching N-terminal domain-containing protein [Nitrososphaerales archaeon]